MKSSIYTMYLRKKESERRSRKTPQLVRESGTEGRAGGSGNALEQVVQTQAARFHLIRHASAVGCGDAKAIFARLAGESLDENRGALEEPMHWLDLQQLADLLVCLPWLLEERFAAMEDARLLPSARIRSASSNAAARCHGGR